MLRRNQVAPETYTCIRILIRDALILSADILWIVLDGECENEIKELLSIRRDYEISVGCVCESKFKTVLRGCNFDAI